MAYTGSLSLISFSFFFSFSSSPAFFKNTKMLRSYHSQGLFPIMIFLFLCHCSAFAWSMQFLLVPYHIHPFVGCSSFSISHTLNDIPPALLQYCWSMVGFHNFWHQNQTYSIPPYLSCWAKRCCLSHDVKSAWHCIGAQGLHLSCLNSGIMEW